MNQHRDSKPEQEVTESPTSEDVKAAQHAKEILANRFRDLPWYRGAGIAPGAHGGLTLRLTVDPHIKVDGLLPDECEGIPVEIVFASPYKPQ